MSDWIYAQRNPSEQLARLHYFSVKKQQDGREIDFRITVWEFVTPPEPAMKFFAEADKQTNQSSAPYTPCGWGPTLLDALSECVAAVHRFPYEGE